MRSHRREVRETPISLYLNLYNCALYYTRLAVFEKTHRVQAAVFQESALLFVCIRLLKIVRVNSSIQRQDNALNTTDSREPHHKSECLGE